MSFPTPAFDFDRFVRVAATQAMCLFGALLFASVGFSQSVDIDLVGNRLNKMVEEDQLTQPQAEAMLATLKTMLAQDDTVAGPAIKLTVEPEATTGEAYPQPRSAAKVEPIQQPNLEVAVRNIENLVAQKQTRIRENRIELQVEMNRLEKSQNELILKKQRLTKNLDKLKPLLSEAQSTGSVTQSGREVSLAKLSSLADQQIEWLKELNSDIERDNALIKINQESFSLLEAEEKRTGDQLESAKEKFKQFHTKRVLKDAQSIRNEFFKTLREMDRLIDRETSKLNQVPR